MAIKYKIFAQCWEHEGWCVLEAVLAGTNLRGLWDLMEDLLGLNLTQQGVSVTTEGTGAGVSTSQTSCHPASPGQMATATPTQPGEDSNSRRRFLPLEKSHPNDARSETSVASFPPLKLLAEVMPCYPSKVGSFHDTGTPSELRPVCVPCNWYFYKCPYSSWPKDGQNRGTICSHIQQVHLGACLSCYVCGWRAFMEDVWATYLTCHHPKDSCYPSEVPNIPAQIQLTPASEEETKEAEALVTEAKAFLQGWIKKKNCWWLTLSILLLVRVVSTMHKLSEYILPS